MCFTEEENYNEYEFAEYTARINAEFEASETERRRIIEARENYENARFEAFETFGVLFVENLFLVRWT